MSAFAKLLEGNAGLWESVGFYTFFLGLFLLTVILLALLFEKERWLLPLIVVSFVLVAAMAWSLERKGPLIPVGRQQFKVVYVNRPGAPLPRVDGENESAYRERVRMRAPLPPVVRQPPQPRASISVDSGGRTEVIRPSAQPAQPPSSAPPVSAPAASAPVSQPAPQPVRVTPPSAPPIVAQPAPQPVAQPVRQPISQPAVQPSSPPPPKPVAARTETPAAPASPPPKREPSGAAVREPEGLVLPTGTLVIQITSTLLLTVPGEASKNVMSVTVDGKGVGGRKASSMKVQKDESEKILNVTYFWKGAVIRLTNLTTGNHRVSVTIRASGEGFNKSKTAWSGTVHVGEGGTTTVVLQGGFGDTLSRVQ